MSKAILLSIQPRWVAAIRDGEKTAELRRVRPRLDVPFKVYMYQTRNTKLTMWTREGEKRTEYKDMGKVVGEFICNNIQRFDMDSVGLFLADLEGKPYVADDSAWKLALTDEEIRGYCHGKRPWGWHISSLKFYDEPKELSELGVECAPQSFVYVEEIT